MTVAAFTGLWTFYSDSSRISRWWAELLNAASGVFSGQRMLSQQNIRCVCWIFCWGRIHWRMLPRCGCTTHPTVVWDYLNPAWMDLTLLSQAAAAAAVAAAAVMLMVVVVVVMSPGERWRYLRVWEITAVMMRWGLAIISFIIITFLPMLTGESG